MGVVLDCMKESGDEGSPAVLAEKNDERMVSERLRKMKRKRLTISEHCRGYELNEILSGLQISKPAESPSSAQLRYWHPTVGHASRCEVALVVVELICLTRSTLFSAWCSTMIGV